MEGAAERALCPAMKVVVDAGPIVALAKAGQLILLPKLFDEIIVPQSVMDEVAGAGETRPGVEIANSSWAHVKSDPAGRSRIQERRRFGDGGSGGHRPGPARPLGHVLADRRGQWVQDGGQPGHSDGSLGSGSRHGSRRWAHHQCGCPEGAVDFSRGAVHQRVGRPRHFEAPSGNCGRRARVSHCWSETMELGVRSRNADGPFRRHRSVSGNAPLTLTHIILHKSDPRFPFAPRCRARSL
jgi:hypothetical protein